jgi:DNA polymerase III alpha subunit (gram-positive type)
MTIYVSFDIETTGMVPGLNSMLSLGAIAYQDHEGGYEPIGEYYERLYMLPESAWDPSTKEWWDKPEQKDALAEVTAEPRILPEHFAHDFGKWLEARFRLYEGPLVFVAYPATFDFGFLNYYMHRFAPELWRQTAYHPGIGWTCLDMLTLASALVNKPYLSARRKSWPQEWLPPKQPFTHHALEDARHQGYSFLKMMQELPKLHRAAELGVHEMVGQAVSAMAQGLGISQSELLSTVKDEMEAEGDGRRADEDRQPLD